ncbi:crotonobetainyl-CoA:carnitine CoA-transferase CaiB-like acyl-CoA transferase [Saccharothrix ecbatanensis]|uniref:Crotonobetainyl-CoA:carnitine CoA-transferase CaiB-like acyl-CoA transferase n=1 Tax=Saccharothrix ecbatanensis TaxID=1105145 RepID=A0A7W9HUI0_9PSEU|nr:CaiB/BaiF CoA-transferase family protein [Saccharothrix ecbatanensis]MBB5808223.1 crotonobetainyl-CoA:carnitine CoA-transferase CaiB-like acyl-CoA transferase [Saccharothrix ecbatanensis]
MRPLDGVLVVSLEQAVAVPYATRLLADLGARVIKIERRDGGDFARHYDSACGSVSSYFAWTNVGKESLTLDLKHPAGREVLDELVVAADVVLCNLSPDAARRLGVDASSLRAVKPDLVVGELSGYGDEGPYASRKAFDALVQSEAGLVELTGDGDVTARAGISVADIAAGVQLQSAVLAALLHRARTGEGATLRLSLFEAMTEWMHQPMLYAAGTGQAAPRTGAHHPSIAPYGPFPCADGAVHLAVQNDPQWRRLCALLDRPDLADDPRFGTVSSRVAHRAALHAELDFAAWTAVDLIDALDRADVPAARTRSVADLPDHPQLTARDRLAHVPVPDGGITVLRPPVDSTAWEWTPGSVPALGEHTDHVLRGLGYSAERIAELRAQSAI